MSIDLKIDDLNTVRSLRKVFREIGRELNVIEEQAEFKIPPRMTKTDLVQEKIRRFTEIKNAVRRAGLTMGDVADGLVEIEIGLEERDRIGGS